MAMASRLRSLAFCQKNLLSSWSGSPSGGMAEPSDFRSESDGASEYLMEVRIVAIVLGAW